MLLVPQLAQEKRGKRNVNQYPFKHRLHSQKQNRLHVPGSFPQTLLQISLLVAIQVCQDGHKSSRGCASHLSENLPKKLKVLKMVIMHHTRRRIREEKVICSFLQDEQRAQSVFRIRYHSLTSFSLRIFTLHSCFKSFWHLQLRPQIKRTCTSANTLKYIPENGAWNIP